MTTSPTANRPSGAARDFQERLTLYFEARRPILYIRYFDAAALLPSIAEAGRLAGYPELSTFTHARTTNPALKGVPLARFLDAFIPESLPSALIVLEDVHQDLGDPVVVAKLKGLGEQARPDGEPRYPVVIVAPTLHVPPALEHRITVVEVPLPDREHIQLLIEDVARQFGAPPNPAVTASLVESLRGLHEADIRQILRLGLIRGNSLLTPAIADVVLEEKRQIIAKAALLEYIDHVEPLDHVGGLASLKQWLDRKATIFARLDEAKRAHVEPPKGFLLVGMPGCGKSLAAKATAARFRLPLLRLDVGKLLGSYVGESEKNMHRALALAEAVSPCVLWIDEIEKAFAGLKNPHDQVTRRLLGSLLTWMQENDKPVFLVATANEIEDLPPELLRRGRFDEVFAVDLPSATEREAILRIHLARRGQDPDVVDLAWLAGRMTKSYSGADLETLVKEALELSFLDGRALDLEHVKTALASIQPMAKSLGDKLHRQKELLEKYEIRPAT